MEFCLWLVNIRNLLKSGGFGGPFIRTTFNYFFGCGPGVIRRSHVAIKFGKNTKIK